MSYQWTDASTPQGRERLKELLDEGIEVLIQITRFSVSYAKKCESGEYRCAGYIPSDKWDSFNFEGIEFLDPSPRLEPPELQWRPIHEYMDIATHNGWEFSVSREGWWWVKKDGKMLGFNEAAMREEEYHGDMETAKAAIHEWRLNLLKSMTVAE